MVVRRQAAVVELRGHQLWRQQEDNQISFQNGLLVKLKQTIIRRADGKVAAVGVA